MGKTLEIAARKLAAALRPETLKLLDPVAPEASAAFEELRNAIDEEEAAAIAAAPDDGFRRWVIAFDVADRWVADGFDPDDSGALDMLATRLGWAYRDAELRAHVVEAPDREEVAKLMGYKSAADRAARGG